MQSVRRHPAGLLLALLAATATGAARAQSPTTRPAPPPAATRPVAQTAPVPGGEPVAEDDDLWREPEYAPVLTTAAEVRALTPEQAATGRPVRIRGTVVHLSSLPALMFVQDATGGVCVVGARDRELRTQLRNGSVVEVEGVTARGGEVAYVTAADSGPLRIEVLRTGRVSAPRLATVRQLGTPALHGELLEVEGVVRSVRTERLAATGPGVAVLTLAQGGGRVEAIVRTPEEITPENYVGALVRARGVFNAAAPPRLEVVARRLLLRTPRDLMVRIPAVAAADLPVSAIGTLGKPGAAAPEVPRARVRGVVTLTLAGRGMFVQDPTGGVWVAASDAPADDAAVQPSSAVRAGDTVDAVGFPGRRGWSTVLTDAAWTPTGTAPMPDSPLVTAEQALAPEMDARVVRIDALVLSVSRISQHTTLALQSAGRVFLARLADTAAAAPPAVSEGSWVRVTGVCVQTPLDDAWHAAATPAADDALGSADTGAPGIPPRPPSFYLLLPSDKAVRVIGAPGWWTLRRVLVVCGILAAVALASIGRVVALRRRVTRQTGMIREHLASRALYEERVRIARELHDSLEQDLLGITMQLNATEKLLGQPDRARQSLQLAAAMVRRSQAETHRAVWDLREQRLGRRGLVPAIEEAVGVLAASRSTHGPHGPADGPRVEVRGVGAAADLPPQVENHLLRVALEAFTNAVKHADASLIQIDVVFAPGRAEVIVRDDGRGFDPDRLPPPSSGHFGLFGMRERAEKLGGELTVRSHPGGGSEIRLVVPTTVGAKADKVGEPAPAEAVAP